MPISWWLVVRRKPGLEAIGIAEYVEPEVYGINSEYRDKTEHWLRTMHTTLTVQCGPDWTYNIISLAEFETFRDLHGLEILGEEK